jgi:hypothetical protein
VARSPHDTPDLHLLDVVLASQSRQLAGDGLKRMPTSRRQDMNGRTTSAPHDIRALQLLITT